MSVTPDTDSFLNVLAKAPGAWVDLNIQIDTAGPYAVSCRVAGEPGPVEILKGDHIKNATAADQVELSREDWYRLLVVARGEKLP